MTFSDTHGRIPPDSSRDSIDESNRTHLKETIKAFLTETSSHAPQPGVCPRCGRAMQHLNATFSLYGSGAKWNIPLPVCRCSLSADRSGQSVAESVFLPEN